MCFKKFSRKSAYEAGVRRCPCCNVQLVWKAHEPKVQKNLATCDHIVPRTIGGGDVYQNMFVMCRICNNERDTQCFVSFVMSKGVSKQLAEDLYHKAHVASLQAIIFKQFNTYIEEKTSAVKQNKKRRKQIHDIIKNYESYFGTYLPEFELLQKFL
jgi:hypothetical protein